MSGDMLIPLVVRWLHVFSAIIGVGGTIFLACAYIPAAKTLPEEVRAELRTRIMRRWKLLFHPTIVVFLASGFYNYIAITSALHQDQPLYHILFGIKFLLALIFSIVVIVATSTMGWSKKLRERDGIWALQIAIAVLIVMIAGVMKTLPQETVAIESGQPVQVQIPAVP